MLDLFSETLELAAGATGYLARQCCKPQGFPVFPTIFQRVVLKLVHLLWKVSSLLNTSEL